MPRTRHIELQMPLAGIHKEYSFQRQPPFSTVDALNVWPKDSLESRRRLGSRPGVEKHSSTQFGGGNPILLTARMTTLLGVPVLVNVSNSLATFETSAGTWSSTSYSLPGMTTTGRVCSAALASKIYFVQAGQTGAWYLDASYSGGNAASYNNASGSALGVVPLSCKIIAACYGRILMAGDTSGTGAPRTVYASRVGDANDYDYAQTDDDAAYSEQVAPQGAENDSLTAIVPWYGDYCLFFYKQSTVLQFGDRGTGNGQYYTISTKVGCLDAMSWCRGPNDDIYFMSKEGLMAIRQGSRQPEFVSSDMLPNDLLQIDPSRYHVVMAWDARSDVIHICVTNITGGQDTNRWVYDLNDKGFWKGLYDSNCDPFSVCYYPEAANTMTTLVWGTRNGYLRRDSTDAETDDGVNFDSYVWIGPVLLGDGLTNGIVNRLGAALNKGQDLELATEDSTLLIDENSVQLVTEATTTGGANYALYVGNSPQEAYLSTAAFSAALTSGRNKNHLPRKRGVAAYVKLYGTAGSKWSPESLTMEVVSGGRYR